jgi:hypothetical protein
MKINKNLSPVDRCLRGVIGIAVTGFAFFNGDFISEPIIEVLLGTFGVLNLISLVTCWCVVYQVAGISTRATP